jgi:hypothetical protein
MLFAANYAMPRVSTRQGSYQSAHLVRNALAMRVARHEYCLARRVHPRLGRLRSIGGSARPTESRKVRAKLRTMALLQRRKDCQEPMHLLLEDREHGRAESLHPKAIRQRYLSMAVYLALDTVRGGLHR